MNRWIANALGISLIAAVGLTVYGGYVLERHLLPIVDSYGGTQTLGKLNQVLDTINRPCATDAEKSAKKDHPCGTLGNIDKGIVKVGDLLATSQFQERDIAKAAEHNMAAVDGLAGHLNKTADALTGTANGATQTLAVASVDLKTLDNSLTAVPPLLQAYTRSGDDLDALLKDNAIHQTIGNVADLTGNLNGIAMDGRKVTDKLTDDFVTPKPWYRKIGPRLSDLWDYGALVARHTP